MVSAVNDTTFWGEDRPWGRFTILEEKAGFKVKRLTVNPGQVLSLQSHEHRSEHWVVVAGVATVTLGEDVRDYQVNEAVYISPRQRHRLANNTDTVLEVIEVQCGDYLGEDDIQRYEDRYNRA